MHEADFHFHDAKARCCLTREQSASDDHDGFFQIRHFPQCERVADGSKVDDIAKACSSDRRAHRAASHRQTCFGEFDAFAVGEPSKATLDVQLRHHCAEASLDFMGVEPALIAFLEFFQICCLFTQKALR